MSGINDYVMEISYTDARKPELVGMCAKTQRQAYQGAIPEIARERYEAIQKIDISSVRPCPHQGDDSAAQGLMFYTIGEYTQMYADGNCEELPISGDKTAIWKHRHG